MKIDALFIEDKEKVASKKIEIADPAYGQLQIDVKACGICAWDRYLYQGKSTDESFPYQFGHEAVGIVNKIGAGVSDFKVGDKVFCVGGAKSMAELINVPSFVAGKIPAEVEDYYLWVGEPVSCVVNGIDQLQITPGDQTVLIGTGYMGMLTIQGLNHTLAGEVIAFDIDDSRLELAREFGADQVYNILSEKGKNKLKEIKEAGGTDIVIEASGVAESLNTASDILKKGGTISLFAWHRGERNFDGSHWHLGGFKIINSSPMSDLHYEDRPAQTASLLKKRVFKQEKLITHVSPYTQANEILEIAKTQKDGYIKGVITF